VRAAQPAPVGPALLRHQERSKRRENRVADQIMLLVLAVLFVGFAVLSGRPGAGSSASS